jgi:tetrahydromethanopterin S-methyltransferase subunit E
MNIYPDKFCGVTGWVRTCMGFGIMVISYEIIVNIWKITVYGRLLCNQLGWFISLHFGVIVIMVNGGNIPKWPDLRLVKH